MKRLTIALTAILLVTMLFVSCKVEVDDPSMDLVSVVFASEDAGKSLNRTLEGYKTSELYWNYTAVKKDSTNLTTGQVESEEHLKDGTGFDDVTLTLSQGKWLFTLYGYKEAARTTKIYEGSVEEVVKKTDGSAQTISIDVQPVKGDSNGYLCITDDLKVQNGSNLFDKSTDGYNEVITVKASEGVNLWENSDNDRKVELAPGSYTVVVSYEKDSIVYASGTTRVTIYSNLTTTVSGTLNESTAEAVLEVNEKYASGNSNVVEGFETYEFKGTPVNLESEDAKTTVTATFRANGEEPKLNVRTYSTLGANSTFEIEGAGAVVAGFDFSLTDATIDGVVIVKTTIASGLSDVKIYHNGVLMDETACENEDSVKTNGDWYYNVADGTFVFATSSFSSFVVTSSAVVALNETNGSLYKTLQDAVNEANDGDVIILQKDASGGVYFGYNNDNTDWAKDEVKSFIVDFNGTTYDANPTVGSTNTKTNGFQMLKGNTVTLRNGTLKSGAAKILIQNYCNLTLENMNLISSVENVLSNNCGKVSITGDTNIENTGGRFAFDACWATVFDGLYSDGTQVVVDTTGTITGTVRFDLWGTYGSPCNTSLVIENGKFVKFKILVDDVLKEDAKKNIKIVGGTFDSDPSEYVAEGYFAAPQDGSYIVRALGDDDVATIDGIYVYKSLQAAVEAAEEGQTIALVDDVVLQERIKIGKTVSVDLNGYKLSADYSSKKCDSLFIIEDNGCLSIDDRSDSKTGIASAPTPEKLPNSRNVSTFCFTLFPSEENSKAKLFINGGNYEAYSNGAIVSGNGSLDYKGTTEIVINDGYLKADTVVYHPQRGTLKVTGGRLEGGDSAIEMRAGSLIITGGEFSSSASPASVNSNGNGSTTSGSAIAVAQHTTRHQIKVCISGGKFSGYHAMSVMNPEKEKNHDDKHVDFQNVNVEVAGGVFAATGSKDGSSVSVVNTDEYFAISENPSYGSDSEKANFTVSAVTPNA